MAESQEVAKRSALSVVGCVVGSETSMDVIVWCMVTNQERKYPRRRRDILVTALRRCRNCEKQFEPTRKLHFFCSKKCADAFRAKSRKFEDSSGRQGQSFNADGSNSVRSKIIRGDRDFLKKIGLTQKEAKKKLKASERKTAADYNSMERWYKEIWTNNKMNQGALK